jgi:hypothetical protein
VLYNCIPISPLYQASTTHTELTNSNHFLANKLLLGNNKHTIQLGIATLTHTGTLTIDLGCISAEQLLNTSNQASVSCALPGTLPAHTGAIIILSISN